MSRSISYRPWRVTATATATASQTCRSSSQTNPTSSDSLPSALMTNPLESQSGIRNAPYASHSTCRRRSPVDRRLRHQTAAAPPNSPPSSPAQQIQKIVSPRLPSKLIGIGLAISSNGSGRLSANGISPTTPAAATSVIRHGMRQRGPGSLPSGYR